MKGAKPVNDAAAAVAALVAEIRNADLCDSERVDAARLLIRERGVANVGELLGFVCGSTVLSAGSLDVCSDAWALENGVP